MEEEIKLVPVISYQNNYKAQDFDVNININKAEVKENDLALAKKQYPTSNSLVLKVFFANLVGLLVKNISLFKSDRVNYSHKKLFIATTMKNKPKYCFLESTIMTQSKK